MKKLLTIFLLISINCQAQKVAIGVQKYPTPFARLIDNGTFYPATTLTAAVNQYQSFEKGWLIDFQMNVFYGSYVDGINADVPPPSPSTFNVSNVNVERWADSAVANNIDYAVLNVINEYGFKLWNSQTPYNMAQITLGDGQFSPYYQDYDVQNGYDTSILQKFVTEFRERGIEPCVYINSLNDWNVFHGYIPNAWIPLSRQNEWINYMSRLMQEIIIRYGIKYIWIDYAGTLPTGMSQSFYNAVKSADPSCTVIGNVAGETDFSRFPYDIESTEEHFIYGGSVAYRTTSRTHLGTTYYVGQEICATPYGSMSQWYYYDGSVTYLPTVNPFTGLPPWTNLLETDPETFQTALIDEAKAYNKPFLACMLVDRDGDLVPSTLTYLRQFNY